MFFYRFGGVGVGREERGRSGGKGKDGGRERGSPFFWIKVYMMVMFNVIVFFL